MKMKHILVAAVAFATIVAMSACGSSSGTANGGGSAGGKTVCYVSVADAHPYGTPANVALQAEADSLGIKILKLSQEFDVQKGTDQLNTCIGRKVAGIILWPLDPKAYIPGLVKANDAGIPVVLINSPMDNAALPYVKSFTGPDVVQEGALSAEAANKALGGKGNVVIVAGQAGNGTTIGRTDGFNQKLKSLGSSIKVLDTVNADFDQQKALVVSRDLITRFGDQINAVYAEDDTMARGFIDAWKEAKKTTFPIIVGINGQKDAFQSIKTGEMYATIVQSPVADGKLAIDTMAKILKGEKVASRIPIKLTVVTKDNVGTEQPAF